MRNIDANEVHMRVSYGRPKGELCKDAEIDNMKVLVFELDYLFLLNDHVRMIRLKKVLLLFGAVWIGPIMKPVC